MGWVLEVIKGGRGMDVKWGGRWWIGGICVEGGRGGN